MSPSKEPGVLEGAGQKARSLWRTTSKGFRVGLGSQSLVGGGEQEARQQGGKEGRAGTACPRLSLARARLCVLIRVDTCKQPLLSSDVKHKKADQGGPGVFRWAEGPSQVWRQTRALGLWTRTLSCPHECLMVLGQQAAGPVVPATLGRGVHHGTRACTQLKGGLGLGPEPARQGCLKIPLLFLECQAGAGLCELICQRMLSC